MSLHYKLHDLSVIVLSQRLSEPHWDPAGPTIQQLLLTAPYVDVTPTQNLFDATLPEDDR